MLPITDHYSVLVVEDNQDLVIGLQDLLHHDGYAVTVAGTVAGAITLVRAHRFNAIILDLGLPDGDGLEVLHETQRLDPSLPIVIVTAHIARDRTVGSLAEGAFAYLTKPYDMNELRHTLRRAIGVKELAVKVEQTEHLLSESEERFRSLVSNLPGAVYRCACDSNWTMEFLSEPIEHLCGYPASDFLASRVRSYGSVIHPNDRQGVERVVLGAVAQRRPYDIEYRLLHKDGGIRWVYEKGQGVFAADGQVLWLDGAIFDITERKMAEAALKASETRFRAIFDQTFQFIGLMKTDGTLIEANRSALQFAGIREEDVLGKLFWDTPWWTHSPELQNRLREAVRQAAGGTMVRFEATHPHPTGELAYVDFSLKPVRDEHGNVTLLIPEGRDITERKQVEEALRESEERYRKLMAHAPEAVVVLDVDRARFMYVNENAVRLFGLPREALLQAGPIELSPPTQPDGRSSREAALELIHAAVNGGTPVFEWVHRTAAGADITCEVRLVRLPAAGLVLVRGSITDITERKRAEMVLEASEERLRASIENTPNVAVQWYDIQGRVLFWNGASERVFGWKSEEALGKTLDQLMQTPEETATFVKLLTEVKTTRQSLGPVEFGFQRRDGTSGVCLSTVFPIPGFDGEPCFVRMDVDMTEHKRVEGQIQQSLEQLRELTQQLEMVQESERKRIARELHDEFGQIVTALKLDLTWLSRQPSQAGDGRQAEAFAYRLESMKKLVDTMAQSTRRIASSLRPSVLDDLGLAPALQWQARDFQERTGLKCEIRLSADVVQRQIDDNTGTALFRIAQELLTNIIRHANAQRVQISLAADDGVLAMIVTDDGKGITKNDLAKPTSFGLRGIRERAMLIGGEIKIDGAPDQGTTVTLRVPLNRQG